MWSLLVNEQVKVSDAKPHNINGHKENTKMTLKKDKLLWSCLLYQVFSHKLTVCVAWWVGGWVSGE